MKKREHLKVLQNPAARYKREHSKEATAKWKYHICETFRFLTYI